SVALTLTPTSRFFNSFRMTIRLLVLPICKLSHICRFTFHVSRFTFHVLRFTFYVSRFTFHVSRFTFHVHVLPPSPGDRGQGLGGGGGSGEGGFGLFPGEASVGGVLRRLLFLAASVEAVAGDEHHHQGDCGHGLRVAQRVGQSAREEHGYYQDDVGHGEEDAKHASADVLGRALLEGG